MRSGSEVGVLATSYQSLTSNALKWSPPAASSETVFVHLERRTGTTDRAQDWGEAPVTLDFVGRAAAHLMAYGIFRPHVRTWKLV